MSTADVPVQRMLDSYTAAVFARDVDAFVALYDDDVRVFDLWAVWSFDGRDAWRNAVAGWFGSLGAERVVVDVSEVRTTVADDLAIAHAVVTFKSMSADGSALHAMQNRFTWALRRKEGAWKIIHEHSSAPIDAGTMKVLLQR
jgi:uncharacterized protein (TIGR02246 family)